MASSGFLIRFIDIGLIVLFGFVMVSDIESLSQVELAAVDSSVASQVTSRTEEALVTVGISRAGSYSLAEAPSGRILAGELTGRESLTDALSAVRDRFSAEGKTLVVLIQPHEASILQRTVDAMDACDRLGVRKGLQMDLAAGVPR